MKEMHQGGGVPLVVFESENVLYFLPSWHATPQNVHHAREMSCRTNVIAPVKNFVSITIFLKGRKKGRGYMCVKGQVRRAFTLGLLSRICFSLSEWLGVKI